MKNFPTMPPHAPSLAPAVDPTVLASLSGLLASDFRNSRSAADLERRLSNKGFIVRGRNLLTAPHGKMICSLSRLGLR